MPVRRHPVLSRSLLACSIATVVAGLVPGIAAADGLSIIVNSGSIPVAPLLIGSSTAPAYGINAGDLASSSLVNSGNITAAYYGIFAHSMSAATLGNTGHLAITAVEGHESEGAWGLFAGSLAGNSAISNGGTIEVSVSSGSTAAAFAISAGDLSGGSSITNSGAITATSDVAGRQVAAYGMSLGNVTQSYLANSGAIEAYARGGDGWVGACGVCLNAVDSASTFDNSGSISASAASRLAEATGSAYGVYARALAAGATFVNTGTIAATGSDAMDVRGIRIDGGDGTVSNDGIIEGDVALAGTVSLVNAGNLSLAAGRGSQVGGHYTQEAGGALSIVARDVAHYGSITVAGAADFSASARLVVALDPALVLQSGDVLQDVVSAGSLVVPESGFDIVDSSLFWSFANVGDATSVDLQATRVSAASALAGSNLAASEIALADVLAGGDAGAPYAAVNGALNNAPTAGAVAAILRQLGPSLAGAAGRAARGASSGIGALVDARRGETGAASGDAGRANALWLKTFVGNAEQETVAGVEGFTADTSGFVIGLDGEAGDGWRLGVAVAQALTDAGDVNSALDIDTLQATVYGRYAISDSTALDVDVSHVLNAVDSTRGVGFAGAVARASYDGRQSAVGLGLTHRASVCSGFALLPGVSVRYRQVHLDGYSETGAGVYDLTVQGRSDSSLLWQARLGMEVGFGSHGTLLGSLGAGYDTLDAASATATLSGTGPTFISQGAKPDATVLDAGIGYRYVTATGVEINALYELEDRDSFNADTASLKFRLPF